MIKALRCVYSRPSAHVGILETHPQGVLIPALFADTLFLEATGPCHEESIPSTMRPPTIHGHGESSE